MTWHRNRDRTNAPRFCAYGERGIYSIVTADGLVYLTVFSYGLKRIAQAVVPSATVGKEVATRLDAKGPRYDQRSRLDASIRRHAATAQAVAL